MQTCALGPALRRTIPVLRVSDISRGYSLIKVYVRRAKVVCRKGLVLDRRDGGRVEGIGQTWAIGGGGKSDRCLEEIIRL